MKDPLDTLTRDWVDEVKPKRRTKAKKGQMTMKDRKAMIAKIHVGKKQLGLDEDTYRALLYRLTNHESCGEMTDSQLDEVLSEMRRLGFKPVAKHGTSPRVATDKKEMLSKIEAILTDKGLHWNYAKAMAKRMFGKDAIEFLDPQQMYKLTQALAVHQQRTAEA